MKRLVITSIILFCFCAYAAFSLELELVEGVGNLSFNKDNTTALGADEAHPGTFLPVYYPLIKTGLRGDFNGVGINFGFERDPILRNNLYANVRFEFNYFFIEGGPFLGLFNTKKLPVNPGVSAAVGLMLPGIFFAQAGGSSTLAAIPMEKEGNYSRITADLGAGFWVPHVICSFNTSMRNYTLRDTIKNLIEDEVQRYFFRADVFSKNYGYTVKVDMGLQVLKRSYTFLEIVGTDIVKNSETDVFRSIYIGMEGSFSVAPGLKLLLGAEMPVYSWPGKPILDPPKKTVFFEARAGIILTLQGKTGPQNQ